MADLTDKEVSFLDIIEDDEVSRRYSFQKLSGLKWFKPLEKRNFFDPNNNPSSNQTWDVLNYLLNTLKSEEKIGEPYLTKYLTFIQDVTKQTKPEHSNYRTWQKFAEMLPYLADHLDKEFVENCIPAWLNNRFTTSIVVRELGDKLLPKLIEAGKEEAALTLLKNLLEVEKKDDSIGFEKYKFVADDYWVSKFLDNQLHVISELGFNPLNIFEEKLKRVLRESDKNQDLASIIWRPAIEDHEQNSDYDNKAKNVLVETIRDFLQDIEDRDLSTEKRIQEYLESNFYLFKRIALNHLNQTWPEYKSLVSKIAHPDFFKSYCKHEYYKLLETHFDDFEEHLQNKILSIIEEFTEYSDEKYREEQIASNKLGWLTAIKNSSNQKARDLYRKNIEITGNEPSHPSFPFYMESGVVIDESPYSVSELASLSTEDLIKTLNDFDEEKSNFNGPNKRGLADSFKQFLDTQPDEVTKNLDGFLELKDFYLFEIIRHFRNNIEDDNKKRLTKALEFCETVIEERKDLFEASFSKTLKEINRFLVEVTRSDEIVTSPQEFDLIESIITGQLALIENDKSSISGTKSRLTKAINTLKGKVLEALINYALLRCRLYEKNNDDHTKVWKDLQSHFDKELKSERVNYVTTAIYAKYLPNLLYLNNYWVEQNLSVLFSLDKKRELWLAAIDGYGYSKYLNIVFDFLIDTNQFEKILEAYDNDEIEYRIFQKYVQSVAIHYIVNEDSKGLEVLFERGRDDELADLVAYIWRTRDNLQKNNTEQVFKLWEELSDYLEGNESDFKKTLSYLSNWSVFVSEIDEDQYLLLRQAAPYAYHSHHMDIFLEELNRLVKDYPEESVNLFTKSLEFEIPYLNDDEVKSFLKKVYNAGYTKEGRNISDKFFEQGFSNITDYWIQLNEG